MSRLRVRSGALLLSLLVTSVLSVGASGRAAAVSASCGASWTQMPVKWGSGLEHAVPHGVTMFSPAYGAAVGSYRLSVSQKDLPLAMTWDGTTWQRVVGLE